MKPIPLHLLNMTAVYTPPIGEDDYGNPVYGTPVNLSSVYIEYTDSVNTTSFGEQERDDAVLFFDEENSAPRGQIFKNNGKITSDGGTFKIRISKPFRNPTTNIMHHWELNLVGN